MSPSPRPSRVDALVEDPRLAVFAPLLYVAWADGTLSLEQRDALQLAARELRDAERSGLEAWLDPDHPPSATELLGLLRFVRTELGRLAVDERGSLADLGLRLSRATPADAEASARALREVEAVLGLRGSELARELFADRPPVAQTFDESPPSFEVEAMTGWLDGDRAEDWKQLRDLLSEPEFRIDPDAPKEARRAQVRSWLMRLVEERLTGLGYPGTAGRNGDNQRFLTVFEALGMFDLGLLVKYGVQFGLFGGAIKGLGNDAQHDRWLPAVARGELLGGFAMTERGHGSNVRQIETVARWEPEEGCFVLHTPSPSARKEWIGNALDADAMVVFAQLQVGEDEHGVHAFFVPVREDGALKPGVYAEDCGHKMGLNGVDNGRLWFDHVRVPRENLLGRHGTVDERGDYSSPIPSPSARFFGMLGTLIAGRIGVASAAMTASKTVLAVAVRYGALRRQFGPAGAPEQSILDYPMHQRRLLPKVATTYALHHALRRLQSRFLEESGSPSRELECDVAALKVAATWHAVEAAQDARECCGGQGFLSANRISEIRRDVDVFATFEGDNVVLLQLVAKSLLTGFSKQLADQMLGTVLGTIARSARAAILEHNPVIARRTDDEHLLDEEFHRAAFAFRTHNLLVSAARRMKKRTDAGMDSFEAFTEIQDHLTALGRAYAEEQVHVGFADAIAEGSGAHVDMLARLRGLYGLSRLHEDAAWFLEAGYFEPSKARAIRKLMVRVCADLRRDAVALVDGFGLPDALLAAPIAFEGYAEG